MLMQTYYILVSSYKEETLLFNIEYKLMNVYSIYAFMILKAL